MRDPVTTQVAQGDRRYVARKISRRTFNRASAVAAVGLTALQTTKVWGANERIRLGFIGLANRGGQLITAFLPHQDMEIVALCDVAESTLAAAKQRLEGKPDTYSGLPADTRAEGHRRGGHRDARPLARAADHPRVRSGEGRVRGETGVA